MTRRLQTLSAANTPAQPKHNVPTFAPPLYKFSLGNIVIGDKVITKNPIYLEDDLPYSQKMTLFIDDLETLDSQEDDDDDSDTIRILVY
ncbi:MAG: hypothetical protein J6Y97_10940, partial [Prevotella sp.]|nr:hypothetical protein [Prevotella sp.]